MDSGTQRNFNPLQREAEDKEDRCANCTGWNFNPLQREAEDGMTVPVFPVVWVFQSTSARS